MFVFEALRAKHGDSLLLHYGSAKEPRLAVIDGGPPGVYADSLEPRLTEIRKARKLSDADALPIDLMMVSHLDEDHIAGVLQLMRRLRDLKQSQKSLPWKVRRFWHNAFDDLTGGKASGASLDGVSAASLGDELSLPGSSLLASVGQGRELRDLVRFFNLSGNPPFKGLVSYPHTPNPVDVDGLELTVLGPNGANVKALQKDWKAKVPALMKKEGKAAKAELAEFIDTSVYNLSSIVVLATYAGRTMLLTGDSRGDFTLDALRTLGLVKAGKPLKVDLLKMPHHGSDRDVAPEFFESIRATHYVISADGKYSNPDVPTLEMISRSRKDDAFTVWLANAPSDFSDHVVGTQVAKFFAAEAKKRKYKVEYRHPKDLGVRIVLAP
jgi:hypothetical protein